MRTAKALAVATVAYGVTFNVVGALVKPGYSTASQFISELNATGSAWATELGWFGFLPLGLLFGAFLLSVRELASGTRSERLGWWLLWSQPVALVGALLAPCDLGCPVDGSASQRLHNLLGVTTYFAGAAGLFVLGAARFGPATRTYLRFAGVSFAVLFVLMLAPEAEPIRGLLQRAADLLLGGAVLLIAWRLSFKMAADANPCTGCFGPTARRLR